MKKPLALAALGVLVVACSSTSENPASGGGGSSGSGGASGGSGGASGGSGGASGGSGGASGGSAGASGGSGGSAGGGSGGTGGASGGSGGAAGGTGGASGGSGGASGGTGGATGGTGGATGGTGGACPTGCNCDGTCGAGESLNNCVNDCGSWRFVSTNMATPVSTKGTLTFKAGGALDQTYSSSAGGASGVCSGCTYTLGSSGLGLKLPAEASGGLASSGDVAIATRLDVAEQIVMVRPAKAVSVSPAVNATYQFFGIFADGTATNQQYGLRGKLTFDASACLPTAKSNTSSTGQRVDGAGSAPLDITFWGYGGSGAGNGCLKVSGDGVTLDHMQTSTAASDFNAVFSGWMSATGNVILLTRKAGSNPFGSGTFVLVKQAGAGMTNGSANGSYWVSHLKGGSAKLGVRGTITSTGDGKISGGSLYVQGSTTPVTVLNNSVYGVSPTGAFWITLPQNNGTTGYLVGQVQPSNGPVIATHSVATPNPGPNPTYTDPINVPSLMLWVK